MSKEKKTVFLTGATGMMGWAGLQELLKCADRFNIVVLARRSKKNIRKLSGLADKIKIVWGDLTRYEDVLRGVTGADYVLHVGGLVTPEADARPELAMRVNVGSAGHVVKAVLAQPDADDIKVVYIGSVAETSDRGEPVHWGRVGDPICAGIGDHYSISKIAAERVFVDSGIRHWAVLRQSGILHPGILCKYDPVMFHVPLRGVLEWSTMEDSGRLLARVCDTDLPEEFWNRIYHISSGPGYRMTNYDFECRLLSAVSCPRPEKLFETRWFALHNFHGQYFLDADILEDYLHFRANMPIDQYFKRLAKQVPWYFRLAKIVPAFILKQAMRPMACKKGRGTQWWIENHVTEMVRAGYGSEEAWKAIPDWKHFDLSQPAGIEQAVRIDHGYDESKSLADLTLADLQHAAEFRGGRLLSAHYDGNPERPLEWACHKGHRFMASPKLVLWGGHWCPQTEVSFASYEDLAAHSAFFAQVWRAHHP